MPKKHLLVIGAGVSGMALALAVAKSGCKVTVLEKSGAPGGKAAGYCCKAVDVCQKCGACMVPPLVEKFHENGNISLITSASVKTISRNDNGFHATADTPSGKLDIAADRVAVAAGFEPYRAEGKTGLGYGRLENVLTARDVEECIRVKGTVTRPSDGAKPSKVGFIQCVGSRDINIGNDWCSRVCCSYAMRLAVLLKNRHEIPDITIFYMDIQSCGKGFKELLDRVEASSIRLVSAIPAKIMDNGAGKLLVQYEDFAQGADIREEFDLMVLSVGLTPVPGAKELSGRWDIPLNEYGFFNAGKGIYPVGACRLPMSIVESISDAEAVGARIISDLRD